MGKNRSGILLGKTNLVYSPAERRIEQVGDWASKPPVFVVDTRGGEGAGGCAAKELRVPCQKRELVFTPSGNTFEVEGEKVPRLPSFVAAVVHTAGGTTRSKVKVVLSDSRVIVMTLRNLVNYQLTEHWIELQKVFLQHPFTLRRLFLEAPLDLGPEAELHTSLLIDIQKGCAEAYLMHAYRGPLQYYHLDRVKTVRYLYPNRFLIRSALWGVGGELCKLGVRMDLVNQYRLEVLVDRLQKLD